MAVVEKLLEQAHSIQNVETKEEREAIKNLGVELREQMQYEEAVGCFKKALGWDEQNQNVKGFADVCGHLSIAYRKWADTFDDERRGEYKHRALKYCEKGIAYIREHPEAQNTAGNASNLYVHMAMVYFDLADPTEEGNSAQKLEHLYKALDCMEEAQKLYNGPQAALGWLEKDKAKILFCIGHLEKDSEKKREAWAILTQAYTDVNVGATEELQRGDQAVIKLSAWVGGIQLTYALFHFLEGNTEMVRMYCEQVLNSPHMSEIRKKEAREMLGKL